jgi:sporulation protein YlmC with PRC-barrel domain
MLRDRGFALAVFWKLRSSLRLCLLATCFGRPRAADRFARCPPGFIFTCGASTARACAARAVVNGPPENTPQTATARKQPTFFKRSLAFSPKRRTHPPFFQGAKSMADITKITSGTLIAAEKVEGTDVYNLQGEKLGTVDDIMIDKVSGKAIYALMSFGGFLGIGEKYHPLPWSTLKYDERKGGYIVNLDKRMLENAPTYDMDEDFRWTPDYGRQVDKYYNAPTYW